MPDVVVVNVHDRTYPRHERVVAALAAGGLTVDVVDMPRPSGPRLLRPLRRSLVLVREVLARRGAGVVVLAEFSTQYAAATWLGARLIRARHVVDGFVGLHETVVADRRLVGERSPAALALRALDAVAYRSADVYLIDTDVRARAVRSRLGEGPPVVTLPVGVPDWVEGLTGRPTTATTQGLDVLYYGNFIPLHGVDTLLHAVQAAAASSDIRLTLVGDGQTRAASEALARRLGIADRCRFLAHVPRERLVPLMQQHDVVAGVFGTSAKARSVIANKVWQALGSGAVVVTARNEALDEIRGAAGSGLVEVDMADGEALARVLDDLARRRGTGSLPRPEPDVRRRLDAYTDQRFRELERVLGAHAA